jgi:hypothetical protein
VYIINSMYSQTCIPENGLIMKSFSVYTFWNYIHYSLNGENETVLYRHDLL